MIPIWRHRPPSSRPGTVPGRRMRALQCGFVRSVLGLLIGLPVMAPARADALAAADPAQAPVPSVMQSAPLVLPVIEMPGDREQALEAWQRANRAVGEFPRGHIDLLRWEQRPAAPTAATEPTEPPATLSARDALAASLRLRPDLLGAPDLSPLEGTTRHQALLAHTQQVQRAWLGAVAAREQLTHRQAALEAARNGADLGQRMVLAGNWSQARLLREQLALADAHASWLEGQQAALQAREALARLTGPWQATGPQDLSQTLPTELPAVPATLTAPAPSPEAAVLAGDTLLTNLREQARRQLAALPAGRLDAWRQAVQRAAVAGLPDGAPPARALVLDDRMLTRDHALERAIEAEARLLRRASERRSFAREAWARVQTAHALALHAGATRLPLQQALEQETLLRYNGMLQSTWDLLAASQARIAAAQGAGAARRDFWLAWLDWQLLLAGGDYEPADATGASPGQRANTYGDH